MYDWLLLSAVGMCAFLGQALSNTAIQLEKAARATAVSYIQIVFAFLGDIFVFHTQLNLYSVLGVSAIMAWIIVACIKRIRE